MSLVWVSPLLPDLQPSPDLHTVETGTECCTAPLPTTLRFPLCPLYFPPICLACTHGTITEPALQYAPEFFAVQLVKKILLNVRLKDKQQSPT